MDRPKVIAFFLDDEIAEDDPHRAVKLWARDIDAAAVECEAAARHGHAAARADVIDAAAALFADPVFDLDEVYDAAEAAMDGADVNAASYIALTLRSIEMGG